MAYFTRETIDNLIHNTAGVTPELRSRLLRNLSQTTPDIPDETSVRYVYAIHIFLKDGYKPMATLAFGDGGRPTGETVTIEWDNLTQRRQYYWNAYTLVYDDRTKAVSIDSFDKYIGAK